MKHAVMLMCAMMSVGAMAFDNDVDEFTCRGVSLIAKAASISRDQGYPEKALINRIRTSPQSGTPTYQAMLPRIEQAVHDVYRSTDAPDQIEADVLTDCRSEIGQNLRF